MFDCFIVVKLPFKAGRLDAPARKVFRNKKKYTRKPKYPEMGKHGPQNYGLQMGMGE